MRQYNLEQVGCSAIFSVDQSGYNFVKFADVVRVFDDLTPNLAIHLAAKVGGIGINREKPGEFFYDNPTRRSRNYNFAEL